MAVYGYVSLCPTPSLPWELGGYRVKAQPSPRMGSMFPKSSRLCLYPRPGVISGPARGARVDLGEHLVQPRGRGTW